MKACQQYLAGCHPHAHAYIHGTHGSGGMLGGLLFLVLLGYLYSRTLANE